MQEIIIVCTTGMESFLLYPMSGFERCEMMYGCKNWNPQSNAFGCSINISKKPYDIIMKEHIYIYFLEGSGPVQFGLYNSILKKHKSSFFLAFPSYHCYLNSYVEVVYSFWILKCPYYHNGMLYLIICVQCIIVHTLYCNVRRHHQFLLRNMISIWTLIVVFSFTLSNSVVTIAMILVC